MRYNQMNRELKKYRGGFNQHFLQSGIGLELRHIVFFLFVVYNLYYIIWRAQYINWQAWWIGLPLYLIELLAAYIFVNDVNLTWNPIPVIDTPPIIKDHTVDVFIPTYNEGYDILYDTIYAAVHMTYPHKTYVLDDGTRKWVKELCQKLGAGYITRKEHKHGKGGNLNNALPLTSGEFIVTLDADVVAFPYLIDDLIGYFADPKMALVQAPQAFYNIDSFAHRGYFWHEQTYFYRYVQAGKSKLNSTFWCGSSAMVRRAALENIGGFSHQTITEDLENSIKLHSHGWKTYLHNETIALGLSPHSIEAFFVQRARWYKGAIQNMKIQNPLTLPGLTTKQRLSYWDTVSYPFQGYLHLYEYLIPPLVLFTGLSPLTSGINPIEFMIKMYLFWGSMLLFKKAITQNASSLFGDAIFKLMNAFLYISGTFELFKKDPTEFKVTPKRGSNAKKTTMLLIPVLFVFLFNLLSIVYRVLVQFEVLKGNLLSPVILIVTIFFSGLFTIVAGYIMVKSVVIHLKHNSIDTHYHIIQPSYPIKVGYLKKTYYGEMVGLATNGCEIKIGQNISSNTPISVAFYLEDKLIRATGWVTSTKKIRNGTHAYLRFTQFYSGARSNILEFLYFRCKNPEEFYDAVHEETVDKAIKKFDQEAADKRQIEKPIRLLKLYRVLTYIIVFAAIINFVGTPFFINPLKPYLNEPTKELMGPVPMNYGVLVVAITISLIATIAAIKIYQYKKAKEYVNEFWYLSRKIRSWLGDNEVEPDLKEYKKLRRLYNTISKSKKIGYDEKLRMFNEIQDIYKSIEREEIESKFYKVYSEGHTPLEEVIEIIQKGPLRRREERSWSKVPTPKLFDNLIGVPLPPEAGNARIVYYPLGKKSLPIRGQK